MAYCVTHLNSLVRENKFLFVCSNAIIEKLFGCISFEIGSKIFFYVLLLDYETNIKKILLDQFDWRDLNLNKKYFI